MFEQLLLDPQGHGSLASMEIRRAVCKVVQTSSVASGFWFGNCQGAECVMTNNHVFRSAADARGATAIFDHTPTGTNLEVRFLPDFFFWTSHELDATVVAFDAAPLRESNIFPLPLCEDELTVSSPVLIIGHPRGRPQELAMRSITQISGPMVHYNMDTEPGNSGSPVLSDQMRVAFLHSSGSPASNFGVSVKHIMAAAEGPALETDGYLFKFSVEVRISDFTSLQTGTYPFAHILYSPQNALSFCAYQNGSVNCYIQTVKNAGKHGRGLSPAHGAETGPGVLRTHEWHTITIEKNMDALILQVDEHLPVSATCTVAAADFQMKPPKPLYYKRPGLDYPGLEVRNYSQTQ